MASGIETLVKAVMRAAGVPANPVEIIDVLLEGQGRTRAEIIAAAFQMRDMALDYHQRLAQIEIALLMIMKHMGISDKPQLENKSNGRENTDDADDGGRNGDGDRHGVGE